MHTLKILIKKPVYLLLLAIFLLSGNVACKQQKCPANGGEVRKPVNKYRPKKPESGLFDKKTKHRKRR